MVKRGLFFVLVILLVNFSFAYELNVSNVSIKQNYAPGEKISGSFFLNLKNAPIDLYFDSNLGQMSLREFVNKNSKNLGCELTNCSDTLKVSDSGSTSKIIQLSNGIEQKFAFLITDPSVSINSLEISFNSNFGKSNVNPLTIKLLENIEINYASFSTDYSRQTSYGCFNNNASFTNRVLDSVGYCEKINLSESSRYQLGANISGNGLIDLSFKLKDTSGLDLGNCNVNINSGQSRTFNEDTSCIVSTPQINPSKEYLVCVTKTSGSGNYEILSESSGQNCGFLGNSVNSNSTADFAIYSKLPLYSESAPLTYAFNQSSQIIPLLNSYLAQQYSYNCLGGCVIPFSVKGVNQNLNISSVKLSYSSSSGSANSNKIYSYNSQKRLVNFSNSLNLENMNLLVSGFGNKTFELFLKGDGTKKVLNSTINISNVPLVLSVYPNIVPAGVNSLFFAKIQNQNNQSITWNFGDGNSVNTKDPFVFHTYSNISKYNLSLSINQGNSASIKSFEITTLNPKDYLNQSLQLKRIRLNQANADLNKISAWYRSAISQKAELDLYKSELDKIEVKRNNAVTSQDFLNVASELNSLNVPWFLIKSEDFSGRYLTDSSKINPSIIQQIFPSSLEDEESSYKNGIFSWQLENTDITYTKKKYDLIFEDDSLENMLVAYDFDITSNANEESYIVILKDFAEVNFNSDNSFRKIGNSVYYPLAPNENKKFSFYVSSSEDVVIYVSPKLNSIVLTNELGVCNFNERCEKNLGENYKNCRSDCTPTTPAIIWIIIFLVFSLIVYTILQVWYKKKYQEYLFKDTNNLFNLIMFINNAKINGLTNKDIREILISKGWEGDQVDYALMRANGKNPGMFEVIPLDKINAYLERRKANKITQKVSPPLNPNPLPNNLERRPFNPLQPQQRYRPNHFNYNNGGQKS